VLASISHCETVSQGQSCGVPSGLHHGDFREHPSLTSILSPREEEEKATGAGSRPGAVHHPKVIGRQLAVRLILSRRTDS